MKRLMSFFAILLLTPSAHAGPEGTQILSFANPDAAAMLYLSTSDDPYDDPIQYVGQILYARDLYTSEFAVEVSQSAIKDLHLEQLGPTLYSLQVGGSATRYVVTMATRNPDPQRTVYSGVVTDTVNGGAVQFVIDDDPGPAVFVGIGAAAICGLGMVIDAFSDSCAKEARDSCGENGVQSCKAKITEWSLLTGCRRSCEFTCLEPD